MRISDWSSDVCSSDLIVAGEGGGKVPGILAPRRVLDPGAHRVGALLPEFGAIDEAERGGGVGEPVARRPAHRRRIGMDIRFGAHFPDPGIAIGSNSGQARVCMYV